MADNELGAFIRSRREALSPEEVGLSGGGRRRTPGLRRAELATIAGVSVDYLIRLEQGRDTHPSASVVAALADALQLDEEDRIQVGRLGALNLAPELCPAQLAAARAVRPTVAAMVASLDPAPAYVLNYLADILTWTETYAALSGPLGILDAKQPNLIRFTFADRRARSVYPDWERVATQQVASLRTVAPGNAEVDALVAELADQAGEEFTRRWEARPVKRNAGGTKRIVHPVVGELTVGVETMQLSDRNGQRLVYYLPADKPTAVAFDSLAGRRPGALHAVGS